MGTRRILTETFPSNRLFTVRKSAREHIVRLEFEFNSSIAARDEFADLTIRGVKMVLGLLQSSRMRSWQLAW